MGQLDGCRGSVSSRACRRWAHHCGGHHIAAASGNRQARAFSGTTDIFITPGYRFRAVDLLITNFHLPKSTLFMLVSAFAGLERMKAAYAHAIAQNYRFYSYGDASLLLPAP